MLVKGIGVQELLWEELQRDFDIFRAFERGAQVEVFNIGGHPICTVGDDRVDEHFDHGEVSDLGGDLTRIINAVATSSAAHTIRFDIVDDLFFDLGVVVGGV